MVVPPPYDPVLLREHAFHDTGLKSLVIAPGSDDGSFHPVAEKGLGLFRYNLASHFEIDKVHHSLTMWQIFNVAFPLFFVVLLYYLVNYLYLKSGQRRDKSAYNGTTTPNIIPTRLLSPFSHMRTKSSDIESQELSDDDFNYIPALSNSLTNTPKTPDLSIEHSQLNLDSSFNRTFHIHEGILVEKEYK